MDFLNSQKLTTLMDLIQLALPGDKDNVQLLTTAWYYLNLT